MVRYGMVSPNRVLATIKKTLVLKTLTASMLIVAIHLGTYAHYASHRSHKMFAAASNKERERQAIAGKRIGSGYFSMDKPPSSKKKNI